MRHVSFDMKDCTIVQNDFITTIEGHLSEMPYFGSYGTSSGMPFSPNSFNSCSAKKLRFVLIDKLTKNEYFIFIDLEDLFKTIARKITGKLNIIGKSLEFNSQIIISSIFETINCWTTALRNNNPITVIFIYSNDTYGPIKVNIVEDNKPDSLIEIFLSNEYPVFTYRFDSQLPLRIFLDKIFNSCSTTNKVVEEDKPVAINEMSNYFRTNQPTMEEVQKKMDNVLIIKSNDLFGSMTKIIKEQQSIINKHDFPCLPSKPQYKVIGIVQVMDIDNKYTNVYVVKSIYDDPNDDKYAYQVDSGEIVKFFFGSSKEDVKDFDLRYGNGF